MMPLSHAINSEIAQALGIGRLAGFHIGNIAIHTGTAILVYFLFCMLIRDWATVPGSPPHAVHYSHQAFAAALLFAVHPISGSAVNYIAARDLLLMVFFFVSAMLVYFRMRRHGDTVSGWLISLLLLSLAILSKQVAIMGFGLVFLFEWLLADLTLRDWRLWLTLRDWRVWARTVLFSTPTAAYFVLRSVRITKENSADGLRTVSDASYPLTMLDRHVFYYLRNFVWPFEMRALAEVDMVESMLEPRAAAGLLLILSTLVVAWLLRNRQPLITFAILAYWLLFSLTSSIFPFGYVVTDYRQYTPFVFLCLVVSMAVFASGRRLLPIILLSGLVLYASVSSYYVNTHWKTEESFWGQSVKYGAGALAHNNYGLAISRTNPELAGYHYREAVRQSPLHVYANINLGLHQMRQGEEDEGLQRLYDVVDRLSDWAVARYWLSVGLTSAGRNAEAAEEATRAADLDP